MTFLPDIAARMAMHAPTERSRVMRELKYALKQTLPVFCGYMVLGIAFGLSMHEAGYNWLWSVLSSTVVFAGSLQFTLIGMMNGSLLDVAVTSLSVNCRMLFYGLSLIERFRPLKKSKLYAIFALSDETYSLLCGAATPAGLSDKKVVFLTCLLDQLYWILGSAVGGLMGQALPFDMTGIDFAMTALFTVIFVERWQASNSRLPAFIGLAYALISLFVFGPSNFLLPALIAIVFTLFLLRDIIENKEEEIV